MPLETVFKGASSGTEIVALLFQTATDKKKNILELNHQVHFQV